MRPPGLLGRSILGSVLVAAVASVATFALTTEAARVTAEREQVRVADIDDAIIDGLESYGRSRPGWAGAEDRLAELAASSERLIVITDVDGNALASSTGTASDQSPTADTGDPTALLDPLADILAAATAAIPAAYDALSLPAPLLAARPGGSQLRAVLRRDDLRVAVCLDYDIGDDAPPVLPQEDLAFTDCDDAVSARRGGGGDLEDLARLQSVVASEQHRCLQRRGVSAVVARVVDLGGIAGPDLLTVHLPQAAGPDDVAPEVARAWEDCTTAVLTRHLESLVAPSAVLYVSETREIERGVLDRIGGGRILFALAVVLMVAILASLLASRRVLRPVRQLTAATQEMAAGRLTTRVAVTGHDEVARLGRSFNNMAEALAEADGQRRRMVSDVAHELRTPLSNLRGYLEAGRDGVLARDDGWTESLLEEAVLLQHVVDDLAVLAEADAGRLTLRRVADDVGPTIDTALLAMRGYADSRSVSLARTGLSSAQVAHDPIRVRQVVSNLLSNAVRHSPEGATVTVDLRLATGDHDRPGVVIEVADEGEGIAPQHLPHVFERFFRADASRARETGGSGLGLSIVEQLVEAHGGRVSADHRAGGGAVFTVWLPADPPPW